MGRPRLLKFHLSDPVFSAPSEGKNGHRLHTGRPGPLVASALHAVRPTPVSATVLMVPFTVPARSLRHRSRWAGPQARPAETGRGQPLRPSRRRS